MRFATRIRRYVENTLMSGRISVKALAGTRCAKEELKISDDDVTSNIRGFAHNLGGQLLFGGGVGKIDWTPSHYAT